MRKTAIPAVAPLVLMLAAPILAQPYGQLWLVPETESGYESTCLFEDDDTVNLCKVAVVLAVPGNYSGVADFRVVGSVLSWIFLSAESDFTISGNVASNVSVDFGGCFPAPLKIMTLTYLCPGTADCDLLYVVEGSSGAGIRRLDCAGSPLSNTGGGPLAVNGVLDVPPGGFDPDCYCAFVGTEASTWGAIKSLYQ